MVKGCTELYGVVQSSRELYRNIGYRIASYSVVRSGTVSYRNIWNSTLLTELYGMVGSGTEIYGIVHCRTELHGVI